MTIFGSGQSYTHPITDTPVAVYTRTFPVDATLPHLWAFLRDSLGHASLTGEDLMGIDADVANALTEVTDDTQAVHIALRLFPHSIEVEVLLSDQAPDDSGNIHVLRGHRHLSNHHRRRRQ